MDLERLAFRIVVGVGGLVPVLAGLGGAILGPDFIKPEIDPPNPALASHFGYLSGLLLAIGLAFWATLRRPEAYSERYRLLTAIVFVGGLARLWPVLFLGFEPAGAMNVALVMELLVTPAICLWQARIARKAG